MKGQRPTKIQIQSDSSIQPPLSTLRDRIQARMAKQRMEDNSFDAIVIGVGSMGAAACYFLAREGVKVLGIEQFNLVHEMGAHGGQSRLIRKAYFEHPDYVPLLEKAYDNWYAMEALSGIQLYYPTGLLYFGESENEIIAGVKKSAKQYALNLKPYHPQEQQEQFPQFHLPDHFDRLIEPDAGFLSPERSILVYIEQALINGAQLRPQEKVMDWQQKDSSIEVRTNKGIYHCEKLVLCGGAWSTELSHRLNGQLKVTRQTLSWVTPKSNQAFQLGNIPCWTVARPGYGGIFYGFPILPKETFGTPNGFKIAHHDPGGEASPGTVNRQIAKEEEQLLMEFLREFIPQGAGTLSISKTCLYTYSPDDHFIIDLNPANENVVIAAGFSGHGFKFVSVIGEILADLAIRGKTRQPIDLFKATRF